jgi:predicted Zn-dependent protease
MATTITANRPLHRALSLALAFLLLASAAPAGDIGKEIEKGLGRMVAEEIESTYGVVDDPLLTDWVNRVGQRLAAASGRTDVKYQFKVLDSDDVNAVAAPGGWIYVNRGTLRFIQSEDELAGVLGHEVGHVAGKHSMKQLNAQLLGTLVLLGFQAAKAETLKTIGGVAGGLAMLKFGRDEENDADRRGLKNSVANGYDGQGVLTFFKRLQSIEKDKPSKFEVYFMTHPPTEERIKRVTKEPGTADSAANAVALGDGYASRFLFRQAAESYKRALRMDAGNSEVKQRLAEAVLKEPEVRSAPPLSDEQREMRRKQLATFDQELESIRQQTTDDSKKLWDARKDIEHELDMAAQSLSSASQMISRYDAVQYRQFLRLARSFENAARVGGNLRAAREMSETALEELSALRRDLDAALARGDGDAARQVDALLMTSSPALRELSEGVRQSRSESGNTRSGVKTLRQAADTLLNSYRSAFGFSTGQFSILDMQVSTAQDQLKDSAESSRKALGRIARGRMDALLRRINFVTRSVPKEDEAVSGIIAHYLGVEPAAVREMRANLEFGDAALALADDKVEQARLAKKKGKPDKAGARTPRATAQAENASVLFGLMAHDLEREVRPSAAVALR